MQGVEAIDILFDPDSAGQEAAVNITEMCDVVGLLSKNIKLPVQLEDAGALTKEKVKDLKETLYG